MRVDIYKENIQSVTELRTIVHAVNVFCPDVTIFIRCDTYTDIKSGDIIFGYGSWERIETIGYKHITLANIDGHKALCIPDRAFDVKFEYK